MNAIQHAHSAINTLEYAIKRDFEQRAIELTRSPDGMNELTRRLAEDFDFGFFLSSFMRNTGKVEIQALKDYINRMAEELVIGELEKHPDYQDLNVRAILG